MKHTKKNFSLLALLSLLLILACGTTAMAETQASGIGTVTASSLRLRAEANASSKIVASLPKDTVVAVVSQANGWYGVQYDGKSGFVSGDYLKYVTTADGCKTYGRVVGSSVYVRSDAATSAAVVTTVKKDASVSVTGFKSGWYAVSCNGKNGYIRSDLLALTSNASSAKSGSSIPASTATANGKTYSLNGATVSDLISYAKSFLGTPYRSGGTGNGGFDCSGFTYAIFKHFGINLPHSATSQLAYGVPVEKRSDLQVGDLVFFRDTNYSTKAASHVGIYIGNSQFIHASSSHTGKYVRINSLNESYHSSVYTVGRHLING